MGMVIVHGSLLVWLPRLLKEIRGIGNIISHTWALPPVTSENVMKKISRRFTTVQKHVTAANSNDEDGNSLTFLYQCAAAKVKAKSVVHN